MTIFSGRFAKFIWFALGFLAASLFLSAADASALSIPTSFTFSPSNSQLVDRIGFEQIAGSVQQWVQFDEDYSGFIAPPTSSVFDGYEALAPGYGANHGITLSSGRAVLVDFNASFNVGAGQESFVCPSLVPTSALNILSVDRFASYADAGHWRCSYSVFMISTGTAGPIRIAAGGPAKFRGLTGVYISRLQFYTFADNSGQSAAAITSMSNALQQQNETQINQNNIIIQQNEQQNQMQQQALDQQQAQNDFLMDDSSPTTDISSIQSNQNSQTISAAGPFGAVFTLPIAILSAFLSVFGASSCPALGLDLPFVQSDQLTLPCFFDSSGGGLVGQSGFSPVASIIGSVAAAIIVLKYITVLAKKVAKIIEELGVTSGQLEEF